jgi:peptidyl-tRNA hydrolase, PTH2 family
MMAKIKMVLCVRTDLHMSVGKIAAQVGHGVGSIYELIQVHNNKQWKEYQKKWRKENGSKKIVLALRDLSDFHKILNQLASTDNLPFCIVEDAGCTEVESGTPTVIAIGPGPDDEIDRITGHLSLL